LYLPDAGFMYSYKPGGMEAEGPASVKTARKYSKALIVPAA
jgi:hypothetical protein